MERTLSARAKSLRFEGGAIFTADAEGTFWIIRDEGTMADFLDEAEDADLLAKLVSLERYSEREARDAAIARMEDLHGSSGSGRP